MADAIELALPGGVRTAALLDRPPRARWLYVMAHGAGAGMHHPFLAALAAALGERGVAVLRYQFPYMNARRGRPDPAPLLHATVAAAAGAASRERLPIVAGGKSMGGRMTSQAAALGLLPAVRALAFVGFPLHPAGRPGTSRADHLAEVRQPMLFLQGTRDTLAELALLAPIVDRLGPRATLHVVEGADHGFAVLKRSGREAAAVRAELADTLDRWATRRCA